MKLAVHQVLLGRGVDQVLPAFAPVDALQPGLAHKLGDALAIHLLAFAQHQLGVHPRPPVGAPRFGMYFADQLHQLPVACFPRRLRPPEPFIVAGRGYLQHPAGHRDGNTIGGELADQPECYFGRTFSRAKYAAARLRISFSSSSCLVLRRSSASSFFSALVSFTGLPFSSASAWAIQFRRHESLMPRSLAILATGLEP